MEVVEVSYMTMMMTPRVRSAHWRGVQDRSSVTLLPESTVHNSIVSWLLLGGRGGSWESQEVGEPT